MASRLGLLGAVLGRRACLWKESQDFLIISLGPDAHSPSWGAKPPTFLVFLSPWTDPSDSLLVLFFALLTGYKSQCRARGGHVSVMVAASLRDTAIATTL